MASYPEKCPYCDKEVDSHDSIADTRAELRDHIRTKHPNEVIQW